MNLISHFRCDRMPRFVRIHLGAVAALLATGALASEDLPIPESRQPASAIKRQQIRYSNSTLMQTAHDQIGADAHEAARQTLETVIGNDPGNNRARLMLVQVLLRLGREKPALDLMNELIAQYPEAAALYRERAFIHIRNAQWESARQDLEHFISRVPGDDPHLESSLASVAEILFKQERFEEAANRMRGLIAKEDTHSRRRFMAECAIKLDRWDEAANALAVALTLADSDSDWVATHLSLGYVRYNQGRFRDADRALQEAATLVTDDTRRDEILRMRGLTAYQDGRYQEAVGFLNQVLESGYDESLATTRLDALQHAGAVETAIQAAQRHLAQDPVSAAFRLNLLERIVNLHIARKDYKSAVTAARTLFEETGREELLLTSAIAAEQAGMLDSAITLYQDYLQRVDDANATLGMQYAILKQCNRLRQEGCPEADIEALLDTGIPYLIRIILDEQTPEILRVGARYELAQIKREREDLESYFPLMKSVIDFMPEGRFLHEYAIQLYGRGHAELAVPVFEQAFERLDDRAPRHAICMTLAGIHLGLEAPGKSVAWLNRSLDYGKADRTWAFLRAQADYQSGNYSETINRLQPIAGEDDRFNMLIGYAFNKLQPPMPGLALALMNRVQSPETLDPEARFDFFANRAYLHYDQNMDEEAIADIESALAIRKRDDIEQVRLRSMLRAGKFRDVLDFGNELIDRSEAHAALSATEQESAAQRVFLSQVYEAMGFAAYRLDEWDRAVELLTRAREQDDSLLQARYLRGISHFRSGRIDDSREDLLPLADQAAAFPDTFRGDLAFVLGHLEEYDTGIEWMDQSLALYPYDIDGWQEHGYQSMKAHRNRDAMDSFERAMDLYDEIGPYTEPPSEADRYKDIRMSLTQEYAKLDKTWSFDFYGQRTDFDIDESLLPGGTPGDSMQGALQSQGGIGIGYRPPRIGFRDEKTLDITLRVLANLKPRTWDPDPESYQGGLGILYKPLRHHNYRFGFERLFMIGDNAEDNWLWRNTYGLEGGERPMRGERFWLSWRGYAEASYYLEPPRRWVFFGQGSIGPSVFLADRLILTFPEAIMLGRYQDNDRTGSGTYWYAGPGMQLRLLESQGKRFRDRWALTAYARYVWGRFEKVSSDISFDDNMDFEGWIIGFNLTR